MCTATIEGLDEPGESLTISSQPNALVLFNPVTSLVPLEKDGENIRAFQARAERLGIEAEKISPVHHVRAGIPPTIILFGTDDWLLEAARVFDERMHEHGNRSDLVTFEGYGHGFFNYGRDQNRPFVATLQAVDDFLVDLGYLTGKGNVEEWLTARTKSDRRKSQPNAE